MSDFLAALAERVAPAGERWWDRPALFVEEVIPELRLTAYQAEVLDEIPVRGRVSVRGPHGLGKTTSAAAAVLWFACTRELAGADWKIVTTASTWRQLTKFLWPEVHKWARKIDFEKLGRARFKAGKELLGLSLRLEYGEAFAAASDDHEKLEGAHADQLLYVFDEAKAIPEKTWDAAEGAFSGGGADTRMGAFAVAISTPGEPQGRFYRIHRRERGFEDWWVRHVTLDEAIAADRISRDWARQRALQWGVDSAVYLNRVAGEFSASEEDGVVPLAWIEAAQRRWLEFHKDCESKDSWVHSCDPGVFESVGVDPARSGPDNTCLALRCDDQILELRKFSREGTMETAGRVKGILDAYGGRAVVDVIGIGAGVVDRLREDDPKLVVPFNAAEGSALRDSSGELGFLNKRAAAWWHLREILDPASGSDVMLPPDDELLTDLCAPRWTVRSGGKIQIESKDDIRKRIGRSTDVGDAVVMAFWTDLINRKLVLVAPPVLARTSYWKGAG